jgi:(1->4)-alpha-D-glucan 1-alpha-D-glucosylmutase
MSVPRATMRLQFHRGFTFADAVLLVEYLARLGISHVYASPIMTARPGSIHGYDTIDPTRINPELGGEEGFVQLVSALRRHGMGIIVDIVPNHMAIGSGNPWWMDVLAAGRTSRYAKYFDIEWEPANLHLRGKVLLPVLGRPYGEALAAGEITLQIDETQVFVRYFDHVFPLAGSAAPVVRNAWPDAFDPALPEGRARLHELLEEQYYRLAWWRSANDEINWRRFFDINELVALRVEVDEVFEAVHRTVLSLYARGLIDGVRVDHIDGLALPGDYCRKLRARLAELEGQRPADVPAGPAYFIVEKILSRGEQLRPAWQTDGTTGYDFMDEVNALQHDPDGEQPLTELWERLSGRPGDFDVEEELARRQILERSFSAQRESAVRAFYVTAQSELATRDISWSAIRRCLTEILAHFPVYRIYTRAQHAIADDLESISHAISCAKRTCLAVDIWLIEKIGAWLGGRRIRSDNDPLQNIALARFQQLSAPLCAKAVEDTAFYRYGRLISRNDVGFDVRQFASTADEFHDKMKRRATDYPHAMLATATHDHKRGEDVRARLAVVSELPVDWTKALQRWIERGGGLYADRENAALPAAGDLAILFQTIVGAWPLTLRPNDAGGLAAYGRRIAAWQQKALREAKLHSDWAVPNEAYEGAADDFIARLFRGPSELLDEVADFAHRIAPAGAVNGLAQVLIKLTAPGVPDIYQGTDYWDFSLVDPDNRAPVDFAARQQLCDALPVEELTANWIDGRIKQYVIARILAVRKKQPELFSRGTYVPLQAVGQKADHVVSFARQLNDSHIIVAFCRWPAHLLSRDGTLGVPASDWGDTSLIIPDDFHAAFANPLTFEEEISLGQKTAVAQVFDKLPIAILTKHSH